MPVMRTTNVRRLLLGATMLTAAACSTGGVTNPSGALISIDLRNDAGASAGRNQVLITRTVGNPDSRQASVNGSGNIAVAGAGTYLIRVIPRSGFVASDQLRRIVTVSDGGRIGVSFTLYRQGQSTEYPFPMDDRGR